MLGIFLYTKNNTPRGVLLKSCQKQLIVNASAGGECDSVMFVSYDLGLDYLKLATLDHNKSFIIPTFCRPSENCEVDEDRLGSR